MAVESCCIWQTALNRKFFLTVVCILLMKATYQRITREQPLQNTVKILKLYQGVFFIQNEISWKHSLLKKKCEINILSVTSPCGVLSKWLYCIVIFFLSALLNYLPITETKTKKKSLHLKECVQVAFGSLSCHFCVAEDKWTKVFTGVIKPSVHEFLQWYTNSTATDREQPLLHT